MCNISGLEFVLHVSQLGAFYKKGFKLVKDSDTCNQKVMEDNLDLRINFTFTN